MAHFSGCSLEMEVEIDSNVFCGWYSKTLRKCDSILVIVDKLTKSTHFFPVRVNYNAVNVAKIFVKEIVRLHGVPMSIMFD